MLVSASSRTCSVQLFEFLGQLKRILWQNNKCTTTVDIDKLMVLHSVCLLYPDSGISMDEEIVLGDMIWSYNKAEL